MGLCMYNLGTVNKEKPADVDIPESKSDDVIEKSAVDVENSPKEETSKAALNCH